MSVSQSSRASDVSTELSDMFSSLSLETNRASRLAQLDDQLLSLRQQKEMSNRQLKKLIHAQHICLRTCESYESHSELVRALKKEKNRISKNEAKQYQAVKQCLVRIC